MPLNTDEVRQIAALSRLRIEEEAVEQWTVQLAAIVDHVVGLPVPDVNDAHEPEALSLPERVDAVDTRSGQERLLDNAPARFQNYYVVPRVLGG